MFGDMIGMAMDGPAQDRAPALPLAQEAGTSRSFTKMKTWLSFTIAHEVTRSALSPKQRLGTNASSYGIDPKRTTDVAVEWES